MTGQDAHRALINGVSRAERCEITTVDSHGYNTGDTIRITDLGCVMPVKRGMDQINDKKFLVYSTGDTTFLIRDTITREYINSTNYTAWVEGGRVDLEETNYVYEGE